MSCRNRSSFISGKVDFLKRSLWYICSQISASIVTKNFNKVAFSWHGMRPKYSVRCLPSHHANVLMRDSQTLADTQLRACRHNNQNGGWHFSCAGTFVVSSLKCYWYCFLSDWILQLSDWRLSCVAVPNVKTKLRRMKRTRGKCCAIQREGKSRGGKDPTIRCSVHATRENKVHRVGLAWVIPLWNSRLYERAIIAFLALSIFFGFAARASSLNFGWNEGDFGIVFWQFVVWTWGGWMVVF